MNNIKVWLKAYEDFLFMLVFASLFTALIIALIRAACNLWGV